MDHRHRPRRRAALAVLAAVLGTLVVGIHGTEKASALDGCWWYANEMGRNSNCDGLFISQKPECDVWQEPYTANVVVGGGLVATAFLNYHGGPCRTVTAHLVVHSNDANCYVKGARTQSGGGEKAVYGNIVDWTRPWYHESPMLYNSGRRAYAWARCQMPDGTVATAKTPILYTPPV